MLNLSQIKYRLVMLVLVPIIIGGIVILGAILFVFRDIHILIIDLLTGSPELSGAISTWSGLRYMIVILVFAVLSFTGLVSAFFSWQIGDQLDELKTAVKRLASGDLNTPVGLMGQGSIGSLGNTLDNMRQQLQRKFHLEITDRANKKVIDELSTLLDIGQVASGSLEINKVLNILAHKTAVACNANSCMILSLNDERLLVPLVHQVKDIDTGKLTHVDLLSLPPIPSDWHPSTKAALANLEMGLINLSDDTISKTPAFQVFQHTNSLYLAPLVNQGGVLGYLLLEMRNGDVPSESVQKFVLAIAGQISNALVNSLLYNSERRERKTAQSLRVVSMAITNSLDPERVMDSLLDGLGRLVNYSSAALAFKENGKFYVAKSAGYEDPKSFNGKEFLRSDVPLIGQVLESAKPYIFESFKNELLISQNNAMLYQSSGVLIPFEYRGSPSGVLIINSDKPNKFSHKQIASLKVFARSGAMALDNARLYQQTQRLAHTDSLTGISNRRHFTENVEQEINRVKRTKRVLSYILFDIDHFKSVNDTHGHDIGDLVLMAVVDRATNILRDIDFIGRMGGEEFALLLPETDFDDAMSVANRLRALIAETPFILGSGTPDLPITISIGVSTWSKTISTASQLYKQADNSLYQAKHRGRNRVEGNAP